MRHIQRLPVMMAIGIVLIAGCAIADRLGAAPSVIRMLLLGLGLAGIGLAGLMAASMRVSTYQVAAGTGNGFASLPLLILATLGCAASLPRPDMTGLVLVAGFALLAHGLVTAPALARAGGVSLGDVLARRFDNRLLAMLVALAAATVALGLAMLAGERAIAALGRAADLSATTSSLLVGALAAAIVLPGGARGVIAAAFVVAGWAVASWLLPLPGLLAAEPQRGALMWAAMAGFDAVAIVPADFAGWVLAGVGVLLFADTALLGHRARTTARCHAAAVIGLVLAVLTLTAIGGAVPMLTGRIAAQPVSDWPPSLFVGPNRGEALICGATPRDAADVARLCAGRLVEGHVPAAAIVVPRPETGGWLASLLGQPSVVGSAYALAIPFVLILTFALMLHQSAKLVAHDVIYRITGRTGTASGRLALQRLIGLAIIGVIVAGLRPRLDGASEQALTRLVLFVAAAVPLPLLLLALWSRADGRAALCGLFSAALASIAYWTGHLPGGVGFLGGALSGLAAGGLAALVFPAGHSAGADAAVLTGRAPGPLVLDRSA